jgi:hypothetical protein
MAALRQQEAGSTLLTIDVGSVIPTVSLLRYPAILLRKRYNGYLLFTSSFAE